HGAIFQHARAAATAFGSLPGILHEAGSAVSGFHGRTDAILQGKQIAFDSNRVVAQRVGGHEPLLRGESSITNGNSRIGVAARQLRGAIGLSIAYSFPLRVCRTASREL